MLALATTHAHAHRNSFKPIGRWMSSHPTTPLLARTSIPPRAPVKGHYKLGRQPVDMTARCAYHGRLLGPHPTTPRHLQLAQVTPYSPACWGIAGQPAATTASAPDHLCKTPLLCSALGSPSIVCGLRRLVLCDPRRPIWMQHGQGDDGRITKPPQTVPNRLG